MGRAIIETRRGGGYEGDEDTTTTKERTGCPTDITQLILDDRHEQRRLFAILEQVASKDTAPLGDVWLRLLPIDRGPASYVRDVERASLGEPHRAT